MRFGFGVSAILALLNSGALADVRAQNLPRQQAFLVGRIIDETRRSVEGAEIIVNRQELRAISDTDGIFKFAMLPGDSTLAFRRIGYHPLVVTLRPLPALDDTILVRLARSPVYLPEVIVSAAPTKPLRYAGTTKYDDVFLRRRIGLGKLITREEIDARVVTATYELLEGTSGIRIWYGPPRRIRFMRCQQPGGVTVFIDGVRQIPAASSGEREVRGFAGIRQTAPGASVEDEPEIELLSRINPSDVEMIEVYRGASEIPAVFHWNGCAVIAIWTRWNK
jgi:hypothetical protein